MAIKRFTPTRQPALVPGARLLGLRSTDDFQVARSIKAGFSTASIGRLANKLGVSESRVLEYVELSASTYHARKRQGQSLSADESSRVYRIAKVTAAAEEFFEGDKSKAKRWLTNPKDSLGGATPYDFSRTPEGSDYVVKLLVRLENGVVT